MQVPRHLDYSDERPLSFPKTSLAAQRARKPESLPQATKELHAPIRARVEACRLQGQAEIGSRVATVIDRYKVSKHADCRIDDTRFSHPRRLDRTDVESAPNGVYIIRTSLSAGNPSAHGCVRTYKTLTRAEHAPRSLTTADLLTRPIRHRLADRLRVHIVLFAPA